MEKRIIRKTPNETIRQIRNNVRGGNFRRVSELIMEVLRQKDSDETQNYLIEKIYNDCIAPWVERTDISEPIPRQYENMLIAYAEYDQSHENTERALKVLESIKESESPKIRKKVRRKIKLINLSQELSKDDIDIDTIQEITNDIQQDEDSRTYVELISSIFGKEFPIENLNLGELEKYIVGKHRKPSGNSIPNKGSYPEELQVKNRMKFFKEELDIEPMIRFCDKGIFAGSILLELKDTDSILVEKIINMYANDTYEPNNYGSSTYILPKNKMLDLIKYQTKEKVKIQLKEDEIKGIAPIQHRGSWKENIKNVVEQMKNASKVQTTDTDEQVQDEDVEIIDSTQIEPQTEPREKFKSKIKIADNISDNRKFLQDINTDLNGILTDKMIEQLTRKTTSYSFEKIYSKRLKPKIIESLELLDMPEEIRETEAKKIFLVMKMTREDMSKLRNKEDSKGGISKEYLAYITEQYSCYYDDALVELKKGIEQGLNYEQITDAMKNCILIEDVEKLNPQEKTEEVETPLEPINLDESENAQNETNQKEPTTPGIERLEEYITQNSNADPMIMKLAKKIQGFLTRLAELDAEQLQADNDLQAIIKEEENAKAQARDRIEAQKIARAKLEQAIKEEREASTLAEEAINAEQEASMKKQKFEEKQKILADERAAIQKKLDDFMEL